MALTGHFFWEILGNRPATVGWNGNILGGDFLTEIRKLAEEASANEGCYLYDFEFVGAGGHRSLRVYIDKDPSATPEQNPEEAAAEVADEDGLEIESAPGSSGGASIEDCSKISRTLSEKLEAMEDQIPGGAYDLEVSTPGLERVLKQPWHFEKVIGKKISVKSFQPLSQFNENVPELGIAKQVQGKLASFDDKGVRVALGDADEAPVVFVPFDSVTKAHVVFEFVDPSEKKAGPKKNGHGPKKKSGGKNLKN